MNRPSGLFLVSVSFALSACAPPPAAPVVQGSPLAYSRPRGAVPVAPARVQGATAVVAAPSAVIPGDGTPSDAADTTPRFVAPPTEVEVPSYQLPSDRPLR